MIPFTRTCQRFEPVGELYFYTDTVIALAERGSYLFAGGVVHLGKAEISQHGFTWSVLAEPEVGEDTAAMLGPLSEPDSFSVTVNGLLPATTYFVRTFVTTVEGTSYGEEIYFTTVAAGLPAVTTAPVTDIGRDSAISGGTVTDDGGSEVTARGVCWDTLGAPTIVSAHTTDSTGTGIFTSQLTGLSCDTRYYVRAYATNISGTAYGDTIGFHTLECPEGMPVVTTDSVRDITATSASAGGEVTSDGGYAVTARGVCWNLTGNPTTGDDTISSGSGTGTFTCALTGLARDTTHYLRAFAVNSQGTAYGNQMEFRTLDSTSENLPTVTTSPVTGITTVTALGGGEVTNEGGGAVTERGVCWDTSPFPTVDDSKSDNGSGIGTYSVTLSGLGPNTFYYARAYATNSAGTSYGNEITFRTWSGSVVDIDGNTYWTTDIGSQTWMGSNLNVAHFPDGSPIPKVENATEWDALFTDAKAYCWYENTQSSGDVYGALYTWPAAMNGAASSDGNPSGIQGVCPDGWHLPSDSEWKELEMELGMSQAEVDQENDRGTDEGGKMKETGTTHWNSPNAGATNASGFTALPGGYRASNGTFGLQGEIASFWSSTENQSWDAWRRFLNYSGSKVIRNYYSMDYGFSVRCVMDQGSVSLPQVTTRAISGITSSSAQSGGDVTSDGGGTITAKGVCWSTESEPTLSDDLTSDGTGTGAFTSNLSGLTKSTTYYTRAYATNQAGTGYGEEVIFKTYEGTVSDYNGNNYYTVKIGDQVWMAENLKTTRYADGSDIPLVETGTAWDALVALDKGYCWYENMTSNRDTYGGLYNWAAAMNGAGGSDANPSGVQGACPDGWHLPSDAEWTVLSDYLGGGGIAGGKMKEAGTVHWDSPNTGATNESGFAALPAGTRDDDGTFDKSGSETYFWSSHHDGTTWAWARNLLAASQQLRRDNHPRGKGFSIRCVLGSSEYALPEVTTDPVSNITEASAQSGGTVTSDGGGSISARGVCWSTESEPTLSDDFTSDGTGTGAFTSNMAGLDKSTLYHVRAYATNQAGTGYGEEVLVKTYEGTLTDHDGWNYWTVKIGDQHWMAENLKTSLYADGTVIPKVTERSAWDALEYDDRAFCYYDNSSVNRDIYGALYTWAAAMNGAGSSDANPSNIQGVCPDGWHLPSDAEWKEMEIYLGMLPSTADNTGLRSSEGFKLKEAGTGHWREPNEYATNESGFTAIPGGYRNLDGFFAALSSSAFFWTSAESDASNGWSRDIYTDWGGVNRTGIQKDKGYAVRCVEGQGYSIPTVSTTAPTNVKSTSAQSGGNVSDDGGSAVTARGVCWSLSEYPTVDDEITTDGSGPGSFTSQITGLYPDTIYYVSAYATNSVGTAYGEVLSFRTLPDCPEGMLAYWQLEESGPSYADVLGVHEGTTTSAPARVTGFIGSGQEFNGVDTYIEIGDHDDFDWLASDSYSIELWTKFSGTTPGIQILIGRDQPSASDPSWYIARETSDGITLFLQGSEAVSFIQSPASYNDDEWHQVAAVLDNVQGKIFLYMDGLEVGQKSVTSPGHFVSVAPVSIGRYTSAGTLGYYFEGVLDEIAIFDKALSASEVYDHYINGTSGAGYCD